jgi:hypothetical protein
LNDLSEKLEPNDTPLRIEAQPDILLNERIDKDEPSWVALDMENFGEPTIVC